MKKTIITINGKPGSGKSSAATGVAQELGFQRFSSGDFMRRMAVKRGISITELNILAETDKQIDFDIDEEVRKTGELEDLVIDSRMAFHWIPSSFKVYLDLPPDIAKDRIMQSLKSDKLRQASEHEIDEEAVYEKMMTRLASENKRYMDLYGVDNSDPAMYDLILDTSKSSLEEVVQEIVSAYKNWLNQ
ncbi:MAG: (d)CMP kinase [Candidatus Paceibacteria bacterium]